MSFAKPTSAQGSTGAPRSDRPKPALRLVKTQEMPREQWLEVRQQGIGSSDAAAAVGLHPYKSPLTLWLEKTGRLQAAQSRSLTSSRESIPPDPSDASNVASANAGPAAPARSQTDHPVDDNSPLYWGTLLEPIVAAHYTKRTGHRVRRVNAVLQHPHKPWMLANLDREVVGTSDVQILECKTAGIQGSRLWQDGVPEYVQLQVLHQLAVTGKEAADVAVLLGGQTFEVHRIHRNQAMIDQLMALEEVFWLHVREDRPPPADGSLSSAKALLAMFPRDSGQTLDLRDDLVMNALFSDYLDTRQQLQKYEALEAQLRQSLQQRMGPYSRLQFEQGSVTWKQAKDASILNAEALTRDHPEIARQYQKVKAGGRRFLVQSNRGDPPASDPSVC